LLLCRAEWVTDLPAGRTAAEQLVAAQEALRGMELRLKPEHPDMVAARRLIAELEVGAPTQKATGPRGAAGPRAANAGKSRAGTA
jgi:hypothetical protein